MGEKSLKMIAHANKDSTTKDYGKPEFLFYFKYQIQHFPKMSQKLVTSGHVYLAFESMYILVLGHQAYNLVSQTENVLSRIYYYNSIYRNISKGFRPCGQKRNRK